MRFPIRLAAAVAATALLLSACGDGGTSADASAPLSDRAPSNPDTTPRTSGVDLVVHRSPTCSCCGGWQEEMRAAGMGVTQEEHDDMAAVKDAYGIPTDQRSCHTTEVGPYFVEGHVPAAAIHDLLEAQPDIDGIALAGMPAGAPGMPGDKTEPLVVTTIVAGEVTGELGRY